MVYIAPFAKHVSTADRPAAPFDKRSSPFGAKQNFTLDFFSIRCEEARTQRCEGVMFEISCALVSALRKLVRGDARTSMTTSNVNY
jgi:hypothetical protein